MRPLLIDEKARAAIKVLKENAEKNILTVRDILDMWEGRQSVWGDRPGNSINLLVGYKVVFGMEQQKIGLCRHLSVSVNSGNRIPSSHAMEVLLKEFGFTNTLKDCLLRIEPNDAFYAIECVDPVAHEKVLNNMHRIKHLPKNNSSPN